MLKWLKRDRNDQERQDAIDRQVAARGGQPSPYHKQRAYQDWLLETLQEGKLPNVAWTRSNRFPFTLQPTEAPLYCFQNVNYLEQKVKREIKGRSVGASFRVAKGVTLRTGGSRGTPVESDEVVDRGHGILAVTTRHLYFNGQRSFRIHFNKLVAVESDQQGVEVVRDRASALSEWFVVGNSQGPFLCDLISQAMAHAGTSIKSIERCELEGAERDSLYLLGGDWTGDEFLD